MNHNDILQLIGFSRHEIHYRENLLSAVGGFIGLFAVLIVSQWFWGPAITVMIVPSMGASAVLLFAAPHAPFSQPWNVIGGHAVSALIGVACWQWIPGPLMAASASVGLAIGAMYFMRCIHPPGGATALAAVIGSDKLHQLGFSYMLDPVLLNAATLLLVAVAFNGIFKWRRYPARLYARKKTTVAEIEHYKPIKHEDFVYALSHIDTLVDISEEDLLEIYELATNRRQPGRHSPTVR